MMKKILPALLLLALAACGGKEEPAEAGATANADAAATSDGASTAADASTADAASTGDTAAAPTNEPAFTAQGAERDPLVASDLDAYVAGMTREIELLRETAANVEKARAAKDDVAETTALLALSGPGVGEEGAKAAGLDRARYEHVKEQVNDVIGSLEMGAAMKPQLDAAESADLSGFTDEQKQQHAANVAQMRAAFAEPYAKLPAELVETFKAREAALAKLRADALTAQLGVLR